MEGILAGLGGNGGIILMYVAIIGVFYFFMIRPRQKEQKKHQQLLASVAIGDIVLTSCGFYGEVIDITDDTVIVEFGNNKNCRIPMQKSHIANVEKPKVAASS
ncbi:MAG: preprotein translocase subunit YajC [Lachnospiraceae bacterium]|jgi:preprotein translocase subunit YajC|nr:preprotein translocase subunit YajC [Lachnospiraceae bacterium]